MMGVVLAPTRIVLFEDHQMCRLRPLGWSTPAWEIRIGLFSLRERLEFGPEAGDGVLLSRPELAGLSRSPRWHTRWQGTAPGGRYLWLTGRFGAHWDVIGALAEAARKGPDFCWFDGQGLVAAGLAAPQSGDLFDAWRKWEQDNRGQVWRPDTTVDPWRPDFAPPTWRPCTAGGGHVLWVDDADPLAEDLMQKWKAWLGCSHLVLDWIWELVPATEAAIVRDIELIAGRPLTRSPFGLVSQSDAPPWEQAVVLQAMSPAQMVARFPGVAVRGDDGRFFLGPDVSLEPGIVIDVTEGPVILGHGVSVRSGSRLEGPLYLGPGCIVKAGARICGGSFGIGCRLAGEIGETVAMDFVNKQHDGFIGHAVLGSWINLGALTTCSDLKNNYSPVRVDLGWGSLATGSRFVGLMAGDHVKTAIGTLFNTGTCAGFAANVFGTGMPPKHVPAFSWGGYPESPRYDVDKAITTATIVMSRRGCLLTPAHEALFRVIAAGGI